MDWFTLDYDICHTAVVRSYFRLFSDRFLASFRFDPDELDGVDLVIDLSERERVELSERGL